MTATTKTHIIDALDEFYGVRCQDKIRGVGVGGGLIEEEEDMNEFDEDVVCLFDEDKNEEDFEKRRNNGIGNEDDGRKNRSTQTTQRTTTTTTTTTTTNNNILLDGIHNGITSIASGVSTGAQFLGGTVVSGVSYTTNASLYVGKTTVNIGKDAVMHSFNALSSTLNTPNVDEELIDEMSNILLGSTFEGEEERVIRGLSIETIFLDAARTHANSKKSFRVASSTMASSSPVCLCGRRIEKEKMQQRACSYLRTIVCEKCFEGNTRVIPCDVLHRWDFTEKPVCKQSLRFLEDTYATPVISLRKLGEVNRYYYTTSISSRDEFTRLRGFLDLQIKVASLFHSVGEKLRQYNASDEVKNPTKEAQRSATIDRNRKALLHFLASIPEDKRRLVRGGDDAKVSIKELKELHEFRKQSEICEYLNAIEVEVVNVLNSLH